MLTYRPAEAEDVEAIFLLNKQLIEEYEDMDAIDPDRVLHWVHRNIEKNIASFTRVLWNGQLAGYYSLMPSDGKTELDSLFVLPDFRNQGIGTQILRKCQKDAADSLFLYVFRRNTGAIALYERLGFQIVKEVGTSRYIMEYQKKGC